MGAEQHTAITDQPDATSPAAGATCPARVPAQMSTSRARRVPATAEITAEIAAIATMPGTLAERAEALLDPLHRITRFEAAYLVLLDPKRRLVVPLARRGYSARIQRFFDSHAMFHDLERVGLQRARPPMQLRDMPVPPQDLPAWAEHLYPAGFREGLGVPLSTSDGRYIGQFGANSATSTPLPDAAIAVLTSIAPLIAHALDPLRTITALTKLVGNASAGVIVTRAGESMALPGLPGDRLLTADSPVLTAAHAELQTGCGHAAFLWPAANPPGKLLQVTALACPPQPPGQLCAVVLLSPPPDLHGLTRRELEVLGLLIAGCSNARIAAALTVSARTIESHIERIRMKLGAASRTVAAVRAVLHGLYLPAGPGIDPGQPGTELRPCAESRRAGLP